MYKDNNNLHAEKSNCRWCIYIFASNAIKRNLVRLDNAKYSTALSSISMMKWVRVPCLHQVQRRYYAKGPSHIGQTIIHSNQYSREHGQKEEGKHFEPYRCQ